MTNINCKPDWNNLSVLSKNRKKSRVYFIPYETENKAKNAKITARNEINSERFMLLNGMWDFKYYRSVADVPDDFVTADLCGKQEKVPSVWQSQGYEIWHYSNVNYTIPVTPPDVPNHNPCGIYKRKFTVPKTFDGMEVRISFLGVATAYHVYINGKLVGYNQVSHMTGEFDITDFLVEGENEICVIVYKWCDGTFLEDQDFFRCNGIFRDVFLTAQPKKHIEDFFFGTEANEDLSEFNAKVEVYTNANIDVTAKLFDKKGKEIFAESKTSNDGKAIFEFAVKKPELWNAEQPNLYTLVLSDGGEFISHKVGFRRFEIDKDGVFRVNGVAVKCRGVNRHDSWGEKGYAVEFEDIKYDLLLMKSLNVNTIRTSHYPNDPILLSLADELGLYIVDEADLETHGLHGWDYTSKHPDWKNAYVDRAERMVLRDRSHACIIMFSLGNESGYGENHMAMANRIRELVPNVLVHYCENKELFDVKSAMYPSIEWLTKEGEDTVDKRPFFMCEYCHSMGLGPGNFKDYWETIYKYPRLMGGCVWEWCDHAIGHRDENGNVAYTYGGDHGEYPNDGNFCVDGLVYPDRKLSTAAREMKQAYAPLTVEFCEKCGKIKLTNRLDFTNISEYEVGYVVLKDGEKIAEGIFENLSIAPHEHIAVMPEFENDGTGEYIVNITVTDKRERPWLAICNEIQQVSVIVSEGKPTCCCGKKEHSPLAVSEDSRYISVKGDNFTAKYDKADGNISSYVRNGVEFINQEPQYPSRRGLCRLGAGIKPSIWSAPTDNNRYWVVSEARNMGADKVWRHIETATAIKISEDSVIFETNETLAAPACDPIFAVKTTTEIRKCGGMKINVHFEPLTDKNAFIPKIGVNFEMPTEFTNVEWYGRGENESYIDMPLSTVFGIFNKKVTEMHEPYIRPQESGNRADTRWAKITNDKGIGFMIKSDTPFNFSAHRYTVDDLICWNHREDVKDMGFTQVSVDGFVSGIGSNSCGPAPLERDSFRINRSYDFDFKLKPID